MSFIAAQNVYHSYDSLHVLRDINFQIQEGEFVSIVGPSGCGKTTLLKIVGGLLPPLRGHISIKESSLDVAVKKRELGFVFQNPVLFPWRTVLKNVELPLEIIGDTSPLAEAQELIELIGLKEFAGYYPDALSGGMKQRVSLARALVFNPDILLMDEPFGALDELTRERMNLVLLDIWQKTKKTILFVTHSLSESVFLSDKVIVLSDRPATIAAVRDIQLPRPRAIETKSSKEYLDQIQWLRNQLHE